MERGKILISKPNKIFKVKNRYPSGQMGYDEDHYSLESEFGEVKLKESVIKFLFSEQGQITEEIKETQPIKEEKIKKIIKKGGVNE